MASDPGTCPEASSVTEGGINNIVSGGSQHPSAPQWLKLCTQYYVNSGAPYTIGGLWAEPDSIPSNGSTTFYVEAYVSEKSNYYDSSGTANRGPALSVAEFVTGDTVYNSANHVVASDLVPKMGYPIGDIAWGTSRGNGAAFNLGASGLGPGTYRDCVAFTQQASYYDSRGNVNQQSDNGTYCFGFTVTGSGGTPTLDGALTTANCSTIGGWSQYTNPDGPSGDTSNPGRIDIYVNGPAGGGGTGWKGIVANQNNGSGHGSHDFSTSPSGGNLNIIDGASHSIYVYQFDNSSPTNPRQLPGSGVTITCSVVTPPSPAPSPSPSPPPPNLPYGNGTMDCTSAHGTVNGGNGSQLTVTMWINDGGGNDSYSQTNISPGGSFNIPTPSKYINTSSHSYQIFVSDSSGNATYINPSGRNVYDKFGPCINIQGAVRADCTGVYGWAQDSADPSKTITVALSFETPYDPSAYGTITTYANQSLGDGHDNHDFSYSPIPYIYKDGGLHYVYAVAFDSAGNPIDLPPTPASFSGCIRQIYDLKPNISGLDNRNGNAGGPYSAPGTVGPDDVLTLTVNVYNAGNYDSPNYNIYGYNPNTGPPVNESGDVAVIPQSGLASYANAAPVTYNYIVPHTAPTGQILCFGGDVRPGSGDSDGNIISAANVWDPFSGSNGPCFKVEPTRFPYLTTSFGDVHASGGIGVGVACSVNDFLGNPIVGSITGSNQTPLNVSYVASAGGNISNTTAGQFLGNDGSVGNGHYGQVCRPDLIAIAEGIVGNADYAPIIHYNCAPSTADLQSIGHGSDAIIYCPPGGAGPTVTVPSATILGRVTFYAPGHNVVMTGDLHFDNSVQPIDQLPGFGVVTDKDIDIQGSVTHLDGYYFAAGKVNTCTDGGGNGYLQALPPNFGACQSSLDLYGIMMAQGYRFDRTGLLNTDGPVQGELFKFIGDIYLAPPPVFKDVISQRADRPRYAGELPPLY